MLLRNAIEKSNGLSFLVNQLDLLSSIGRKMLLDSELLTNADNIQQALDEVTELYNSYALQNASNRLDDIKRKLQQVRDISRSISKLENKDDIVLDDIELFEVKHLATLSEVLRNSIEKLAIKAVQLPPLSKVIAILDPDGTHLPNFYIYDSYSDELKLLRQKINTEKSAIAKLPEEEQQEKEHYIQELFQQSVTIEDEVRATLSKQLQPFRISLAATLNNIAKLDILIAKAGQAHTYKLVKPTIAKEKTVYQGIFNPQLKQRLENESKRYQPVDVELDSAPCLITGANMSGKTVLLKTLQLAQYLFQFGFFVPATKAEIAVVDSIMVSIDDGQEELKGLSSYASEILTINDIVNHIKSGSKPLVLVDELARTTNPTEGKAIVNATIDILANHNIRSIITTHYNGIHTTCRRLRVKGFTDADIHTQLNKSNINDYIDYSLVEDNSSEVPMDAIKVAELLGVSSELVDKIKQYISNE